MFLFPHSPPLRVCHIKALENSFSPWRLRVQVHNVTSPHIPKIEIIKLNLLKIVSYAVSY